MERIVEGLWDCAYCGKTGIGGLTRECTNCGKPRDKNTVIYPPTGKPKRYLSDKEVSRLNQNPDWVCEYCDSLNSDDDSVCKYCSSLRTSTTPNYFQNKAKREAKAEPSKHDYVPHIEESSYEDMHYESPRQEACENVEEKRPMAAKEPLAKIRGLATSINWKSFALIILILALIAGAVYILTPKDHELTVTGMSWERNIKIEEYRTVNESDWYLPAGGRLQYMRKEIHHFDHVIDHYETRQRQVPKRRFVRTETYVTGYENLGNGTFREKTATRDIYENYYDTETYQEPVYRDDPVYQTKYYYEIERWVYDRTATSQEADKYPEWPELNLAENEREDSRSETYTATGKDNKGKEYTFTLSYADWERINVGQKISVRLSLLGDGELISVDENFVIYEEGK